MNIIYLFVCLLSGALLGGLLLYFILRAKMVSRKEFDQLSGRLTEALLQVKMYEERSKSLESLNESITMKWEDKAKEAAALQMSAASQGANLLNAEKKVVELTSLLSLEQAETKRYQEELGILQQAIAEWKASNGNQLEQLSASKATIEQQNKTLQELNQKANEQVAELSRLTANNKFLNEKLNSQKEEMESLQRTAHLQFEKIASQLLEEKSSKFTESNKSNLEALLNPLKEDIGKFRTKVEETYEKESKQRFSLEEKVKELIEQTNKVSNEANNLAAALKGQTKKQGNWGEMILERILETSGLTKDREYFTQQTIRDEDGKALRPDILVKLPDNRIIIIDSKVSLIGYERFAAAENAEEQKLFLLEHLKSIYGHIDDLHGKKYDKLEEALDFTMMFVPIEPAYLVAIQSDPDLWAYAYSKRILLISPTNLIACLKLISDLWNREKLSRNANEIVKRGELLFEKFVNFTITMEDLGKHIGRTQTAYQTAIDQLKSGRGNLVAQATQLQALGINPSKKIPQNMLPVDYEEQPDQQQNDTDSQSPSDE